VVERGPNGEKEGACGCDAEGYTGRSKNVEIPVINRSVIPATAGIQLSFSLSRLKEAGSPLSRG
jgi:hypothetical protein